MYKQHTTPLPQICRAAILSFLFLGVGTGLAKADTVSLGSVNAAYKYDSAEVIGAQKECYKNGNPVEVSSPATYRVPFDGVLTAFSFSQRSTKASKMKIKVLRPDGMMTVPFSSGLGTALLDVPAHKVVKVSDVLPINPISSPAGRFAITSGSLRIPVQQNDFIAMQTLDSNLTCLQPSTLQDYNFVNGDHSFDERLTVYENPNPFELSSLPNLTLNLRVNVETDLNHNGYGDDSQEPPVDPTLLPQEQNVQSQATGVGTPEVASPSAQVAEVGAANEEPQPAGTPNQSSTGPRTATAKVCRVPKVRGLKLSVAKRRIKRAGCRIAKVQASKKKQTTRRVKSTLPKAGQKTTKPVKIILAKR